MAAATAALRAGAKSLEAARASQDPRVVFNKYDEDNSGNLEAPELRKALLELNVTVSKQQLNDIVDKISGGSGRMELRHFEKFYEKLRERQEKIKEAAEADKLAVYGPLVMPHQDKAIEAYNHPVCMVGVALIIVANFLINIIEKEIDPTGLRMPAVWEGLDVVRAPTAAPARTDHRTCLARVFSWHDVLSAPVRPFLASARPRPGGGFLATPLPIPPHRAPRSSLVSLVSRLSSLVSRLSLSLAGSCRCYPHRHRSLAAWPSRAARRPSTSSSSSSFS